MAVAPKTGNQARAILVADLVLAVLLGNLGLRKTRAQTTEHPVIAPDDLKSETCLTCHPDKKEGKSVHTAIGAGCESCHRATSSRERTSLALIAQGGELCARCHGASKEPVQHGPYKTGQCMICHEPHASSFPKQARAETGILCQSCHGFKQPGVKVNADAKTVSLLGGRDYDLASFVKAPKIELGHAKKNAPWVISRPLEVIDSRPDDSELNCLACHDPHASKAEHLLRPVLEPRGAAGTSRLHPAQTSFIGGRQ